MKKSFLFYLAASACISFHAQNDDPYLWLEEVDGQKALEFVEAKNKIAVDKMSSEKSYQEIYNKSLEIYNSSDRIVYPTIYGQFIYNFWQDKQNPRGIWRRCKKSEFLGANPKWETLLDIDELSKKENVLYVYKGSTGLYPDFNRFLVQLSKGGGDAVITREYDVTKKMFVKDGFELAEAKSTASYFDLNTVIVATDFGNNSLTNSGYPKQAKLWKRGTPLADAVLLFEGQNSDVSLSPYVLRDGSENFLVINHRTSFFEHTKYVKVGEKLVKLEIPSSSQVKDILNNQLVVALKDDWEAEGKKYGQGALISLDFKLLLQGQIKAQLILQPDDYSSVSGSAATKNKLLVSVVNNVKSELFIYSFDGNKWQSKKVDAPDLGTIGLNAADEFSDDYFFSYSNFLTPSTLYYANAGTNSVKVHRSLPAYFDAANYKVEQFKVRSTDGTMVPYFVISSATLKADGKNPTLLYAYGGFEVSMLPSYLAVAGKAWLEKGGVYVLANIRGGGEFGPKWHQAGMKEKRQNIYNDFHSVAEDLIAKKITSGKNLGIMGGSNGGLLMGVAFTQRPDLYNAVVCQVPLLDMKRFNKLLAGASWMGEYGDPDKPEEWEFISKYSPYQNLKKDAKYPEVFFTTSTRDDRVHPGHARKMVAKMSDMGYAVYYFENTEGGHAGSSTNEQRAKTAALQYSYLLMKLKGT